MIEEKKIQPTTSNLSDSAFETELKLDYFKSGITAKIWIKKGINTGGYSFEVYLNPSEGGKSYNFNPKKSAFDTEKKAVIAAAFCMNLRINTLKDKKRYANLAKETKALKEKYTQPTPATKKESEIKGVAGEIVKKQLEQEQTEPTTEQTFHCDYCKQSFPYKDENDKLTGFFDAGTKNSVCWSCSDLHYETTQPDTKEPDAEPKFNRPVGEFWIAEKPFLYIGQMSSVNRREIWFYDVMQEEKITLSADSPTDKIIFYGKDVANIVPMSEWPTGYLKNLPVYEFKDKKTAKGYGLKTNHKIQLVIEWNKQVGLFRLCEHVFRVIAFDQVTKAAPEPIKTATVDGLTQIVMPFEVEEVKPVRDPNAELYGYQAKDKTDRQRFKRKLERTRQWLAELSPEEARAIKKMVSEMTTPPPLNE